MTLPEPGGLKWNQKVMPLYNRQHSTRRAGAGAAGT